MAEAVGGLAFASSVLQVLHFSASCFHLVVGVTKLLASDELGLQVNIEIEHSTGQKYALADRLVKSYSSMSRPLTAEQHDVQVIAEELKKEAQDLLKLVRSVKVEECLHGLKRVWRASVQTTRALFIEKDNIEAHQKRLQEIIARLGIALLQTHEHTTAAWSQDLNLELIQGVADILGAIDSVKQKHADSTLGLQSIMLQAAEEHTLQHENHLKQELANQRQWQEERAAAKEVAAKTERIIASLQNSDMMIRRNDIVRAHADTFGWIFNEESSTFRTWLASGSHIFWISGHAGSGKSTLMKYISSAAETTQILNQWSKPHSVFIIDIYLWISGTAPQRTEQGLLQAILYQILSACTDLVSIASPLRWEKVDGYQQQDPWSRDELWEALLKALDDSASTSYFCLFVDGLDEYEGDKTKLLEVLQRLAQFPHLKICASSRPWNVFRNAFGSLDSALCLQDLTQTDIRSFVFDELGVAIRSNPQHEELVEAIVSKAQGVFLWVFLVVRSLRAGCEEGDDMRLLHDRVTAFPPRLEDYFKLIFHQLDPTYKVHTAQALTVAMALHSSGLEMNFSYFWLLFQGLEHADFASQRVPISLSSDDFYKMASDTQKLLNTYCRDFLHMPDLRRVSRSFVWESRVSFLHRTIFDFLDKPEMKQLLHANVPDHFITPLFLGHLTVARAKLVPKEHSHNDFYLKVLSDAFGSEGNRCNEMLPSLEAAARLHLEVNVTDSPLSWRNAMKEMLVIFLAFGLRTYFFQAIRRIDWHGAKCVASAALGLSGIRRFPISEVDMDLVLTVFEVGVVADRYWPEFVDALVAEYRSDRPNSSVLLDKASQVIKLMLRNRMEFIKCTICEESVNDQSDARFRQHSHDNADFGEVCKRNIVQDLIPEALDPAQQAEFWDRCVIGEKEARERRLGILIDEEN